MESSSASQEGDLISSSSKRSGTPNMVMGKHRLAAAIASLNQQIQIIQDELDQLDSFGEASIVCRELVSSVELMPDALLPVENEEKVTSRYGIYVDPKEIWTRGPINVHLDRWFHGANDSRRNKRWL